MITPQLFDKQKQLDDFIIKTKRLKGQTLIPNKILALQVELAELANEWKGFKHWSDKPMDRDKALVEYVDCLHFILSIGNDLNINKDLIWNMYLEETTADQFMGLFEAIADLSETYRFKRDNSKMIDDYTVITCGFLGLGDRLGFTWAEVEQAYESKWQVNVKRQQDGY